ncbi:PHP domain-containing protein [Calothrix rhizosoleniae]|uniref:PHP domain-containing protein n=1 Tax=Calothrix rhizosoleniae TaxID=888997 RepID=UPI000B49D913|nr:PHP domain-containing protein [Calothrix rhizosoleniae]
MVVNFAQTTTASSRDLKQVFENIDAVSCPRCFNFHMHTVYSDGKLEPSQVMEQAMLIGLQGLAITDHHSVGGYYRAQSWLKEWKSSHPGVDTPQLWSGVEINANILDVEVHILGYAFDPENFSMQPYLQRKITSGKAYQAPNIIDAIHEAGGVAILAHPARYRKSHFDLIPAAKAMGIDGVEAFYAYKNPKPWAPSSIESQQMQELADKYNLYCTCGTDTHGYSLLQRL